jgi:addiction module RelE/StbE family toxin
MINIKFKPKFLKQMGKFPSDLYGEVREKIALFQNEPNHPFLKTHKLHGKLSNCWSFSVNYRYRIVFQYLSKKEVVLLCVGDHELYK